jgi:hypothetical protein
MYRGTVLILALLMTATAMPSSADARPRLFKALGSIIGAPIGAIFGGARHAGRRSAHHSRRAVASRSRPAVAAAAGTAGVAAAATGAVTTGAAPSRDEADTQASVPLPTPAPLQRNAALSAPESETQGRGGDIARAPAPPSRVQSRLGVVGPPAWPSAYEDVIGFTLWPKEYGERLRVHGIGDVLGTAFASSTTLAARTQQSHAQQARADEPGSNTAPMASVCGSVDLTPADWPIADIAGTIELNEAQRGALDQFKIALSDAVAAIKSSCRDDANLPPVDRLRAMQNSLWTVHDAAQLVRTPLAKFYDLLTDEQKQKFAAPAQPAADPRGMNQGDMAKMCGMPVSADASMRQLDQTVRPTKAQRASLEALQKKAFEMGQFLMASCLKPMPATPAERLDAAADRLTAVIFAASNVNMALHDFTSQLNDEQKSRLNTLMR